MTKDTQPVDDHQHQWITFQGCELDGHPIPTMCVCECGACILLVPSAPTTPPSDVHPVRPRPPRG